MKNFKISNTNLKKLEQALFYCRNGNFVEARNIYRSLIFLIPNYPPLLTNLGAIELQAGNINEGIKLLKESIAIEPNQIHALINLGNGLYDLQDFEGAIKLFKQAIQRNNLNPEAHYNLGRAFKANSEDIEAIKAYDAAINLAPNYLDALYNRASIFYSRKNYDEAIHDYNSAISINPNFFEGHFHLGLIYIEMQKYEEALRETQVAFELGPDSELVNLNLGLIWLNLNKNEEALKVFSHILNKNDKCNEARFNRANIYLELEKYEEALNEYSIIFDEEKDNINIYIKRGIALNALKKYEEAIKDFDYAIHLNQNNYDAYNNRGLAYIRQKKYINAQKDLEFAINLYPNRIEGYINLSIVFLEQKLYKKFDEILLKGLELDPKNVSIKFNLAMNSLRNKEFEKGWVYYENRLLKKDIGSRFVGLANDAILESVEVKNKVILIPNEQGLGDQILYYSLLSELDTKSNKIKVMTDRRMINLFQRSLPNIEFLSEDVNLDSFSYDYYLPAGSLPKFFRKTDKSFEKQSLSYLRSDETLTKKLKNKLYSPTNKICGISWRSKNPEWGEDKTITLEDLLPIFQIENITFVDLQYGDTKAEKLKIKEKFGIDIISIQEVDNFNDIDGLASLIDACDFIVTCSNLTAHISGALGKETYTLLPYSRGKMWYWHEGDIKNKWYPSVFQICQSRDDNWADPILEAKNKIIGRSDDEQD